QVHRRELAINTHEPRRFLVRQRAQQHAVDDAEDRRVRADPQAQCQDGNQCEAWFLYQHSRAVAQVLPERLHNSLFRLRIADQSRERSRARLHIEARSLPLAVLIRNPQSSHSHRSATIGSTFVARRAGSQQANNATSSNTKAITPKVNGSVGRTLNNKVSIHLVNAKAVNSPITTPIRASFSPCVRISFNTSRRCAPSAIRMPSSCVRRLTE